MENKENKASTIDDFCNNLEEHEYIFNNLDSLVWAISWPSLKLQFISRAVEELIGYSAADFKDDPFLFGKIIHPADKRMNFKALRNLSKTGYLERKIRLIAKNGNVKWIHDRGKMIYDQAGKGVKVEGVMKDISSRKRAEKKFRVNRNRYRTIFNSAPIGFMLEDKKGNILEVNQILCNKLGYSKAELEGYNILDKIVIKENQKEAVKNIERIIKGEELEFDVQTLTKSGQIKDYHLKETSIVLPDGSKGILSMQLDISKRKKLENNLKENNNLLNSVLESIQDGIAVINPDLSIRYTNSTMKKWFENTEKLENKKCFYGFYEKETDCDNCPIKKSLKSGKMESSIKKMPADFELDFIEIYSYPIYNQEENKITGVVEFVKDISERLNKQQELKMINFSIDNADLIIFRVNPEGVIEYANETSFKKLGYSREELIGLEIEEIIVNNHYIENEEYWSKLKEAKSLKQRSKYLTKNGKYLPVEVTSQYFKYADKEYEFIFAQNISKRIQREKEIEYLAYRDTLTDLYNRKFFEAELAKKNIKEELPLSIIMSDLNGLKIINDSYGQDMGDKLLIQTAKLLKKVTRKNDVLARYGGDEFTILLPQTDNETAKKIVKKIKITSREEKISGVPLSISLGTATKEFADQKISKIIKKAEDNMYQNKLSERKSSKSNIVQGLLNTLNVKSSETKEHALRMTKLAFDFGEKLDFTISDLNKLTLLATLHDIGKTSISEDILKKSERLTAAEWEQIKKHPRRGYKIASASEEFNVVAEEILCHHEKWDGSGYPGGLKGQEIPYLARVISIIDAYDVMTNDRPYSSAISKEKALAEIKACAGSQFDPELAKKFIAMMEKK